MKNNFIKNKNNNLPKKAKKTWSYYLVIFAMLFCLVGSFLGTIGFARTFADEDLPIVTNYQPVKLENGVDLSNKWVAVPIDSEGEFSLFDIHDIAFYYESYNTYGLHVYFDINAAVIRPVYDYQYRENYMLFYLDFDFYSEQIDNLISIGESVQPLENMVVSSLTDEFDVYVYEPFNNGTGVLATITGTLTGGIVGLGQGVGTGLSTLAESIFINSTGSLSVFGILVCIFGALGLGIGLCRLVVRWLGSLGGRKV